MYTGEKPVVKIKGNANICYEDPKELEKSIRREEYFEAFNVVRKIERCTRDRDNQIGTTAQRNREQILNVVFFTGERGAGKTSAMLSFMEFLKDYYRNLNARDYSMPEEFQLDARKPYMFTGIECIDASTLNEKDDLLGSVLSSMMTKWNREEERSGSSSGIYRGRDYDHNKYELRVNFNKLYNRLKDLRSKNDVMEKDSDAFLETLEQLSLSRNVKTSFKELVESYLRIMDYPQSRDEIALSNHFLVIPIDDLDMNINYGFMLLEQIRKFLMLPNVIVLLSGNYEQLEKICCNHYAKEFDKLQKTEYNNNYVVRLAREYLEKIVPRQNQVNLSSGQKWRYFSDSEILLKYEESDDRKKAKSNEKEGTLCKIISDYIEEYFGFRFQINGKCLKYLTPDTFRELTSWVMRLHTLQKPDGKEAVYINNYNYFMEEILTVVSGKYLSVEKQEVLEMLEMLEPGEQIRLISGQTQTKDKNRDKNKYKDTLLVIFHSGLKEVKEPEQYAFVVICLLYFTLKLTQCCKRLEYCGDNIEERKKGCQILLDYYADRGWGLWGNWETKILKPIWISESFKYLSKVEFLKNKESLNLKLEGSYAPHDKQSCLSFFENNKSKLKDFQYILLFFDLKIQDSNGNLWIIKDEEGIKVVKLIREYSGRFSLSGFILSLLNGAGLVEMFLKDFMKCFKEEFNLQDENISIIPQIENYFYKPLLPLENLELLLVLGRRLEKRMKVFNFQSIEEMVKQYFESFLEILEELDKEYGLKCKESMENFPLVKRVREEEDFLKLLAECIQPLMKDSADIIEDSEWEDWS